MAAQASGEIAQVWKATFKPRVSWRGFKHSAEGLSAFLFAQQVLPGAVIIGSPESVKVAVEAATRVPAVERRLRMKLSRSFSQALIAALFFAFVLTPSAVVGHDEDGEEHGMSAHDLEEMEQMRQKLEREDQQHHKSGAGVQKNETPAEGSAAVGEPSGAALLGEQNSNTPGASTGTAARSDSSSYKEPLSGSGAASLSLTYSVGLMIVAVGAGILLLRRWNHAAKQR
jgi:hypothetical protein